MDRKQKRAIRFKITQLLNSPNPDYNEINRLYGMLGVRQEPKVPEVKKRGKQIDYRKPFISAEEYIKLRGANKSKIQIAAMYNVTVYRLEMELQLLRYRGELKKGILKNGRGLKLGITVKRYLAYKEQGLKDCEIAEKYGVSGSVVSEFKKRNNIKLKFSYKKTKPIPKEEYFELRNKGWTLIKIAEYFGVHKQTLQKRREGWAMEG